MSHVTELERFHQFVGEQLKDGERDLSVDEAVTRFRTDASAAELADSVAAIRRALEQVDRGEGIPLDEAMRRLHAECRLPDVTVGK